MHFFPHKREILVIILAAFAFREFMVAVDFFQSFKCPPSNGTFPELRAIE